MPATFREKDVPSQSKVREPSWLAIVRPTTVMRASEAGMNVSAASEAKTDAVSVSCSVCCERG